MMIQNNGLVFVGTTKFSITAAIDLLSFKPEVLSFVREDKNVFYRIDGLN